MKKILINKQEWKTFGAGRGNGARSVQVKGKLESKNALSTHIIHCSFLIIFFHIFIHSHPQAAVATITFYFSFLFLQLSPVCTPPNHTSSAPQITFLSSSVQNAFNNHMFQSTFKLDFNARLTFLIIHANLFTKY